MVDMWWNLENKSVWKLWPGHKLNPAHGLWEQGFLDNEPLRELLTGVLKEREVVKEAIVSAVDVNTGDYIAFDMKGDATVDQKVSQVLGSAAMPFVFPPEDMQKYGLPYHLMDGGTVWNNNMESAI